MKPMSCENIIELINQAIGPDRFTDYLIACHVRFYKDDWRERLRGEVISLEPGNVRHALECAEEQGYSDIAPKYTATIDCAMKTFPPLWRLIWLQQHETHTADGWNWKCRIATYGYDVAPIDVYTVDTDDNAPARVLCIAGLRAYHEYVDRFQK